MSVGSQWIPRFDQLFKPKYRSESEYKKEIMNTCHPQQLLQLEKLDDAINKFDRSIELSPKFPTSYVQKYYAGQFIVCTYLLFLHIRSETLKKTAQH